MSFFTSAQPSPPISPARRPIAVGPPAGAGHGRRLVLLVSGAVALFLAILLLAAGSAAFWGLSKRDHAGFFNTGTHTFATSTYAMATQNLEIGPDTPGWFGDNLGTIRIEATSEQPIFVGVGPSADVEDYLAGIQHDTITGLDTDPFDVAYRYRDGTARPALPTGQSFWRAAASGSGRQTIRWPVEKGNWAVVVMNADASAHVVADARLGAKVPVLPWATAGLLAAGAVVLLVGAALVYFGTGSTPARSRS